MTILSGPPTESRTFQRRSSIAGSLATEGSAKVYASPEAKLLRTVTLNAFKPQQVSPVSKTPLLQTFIESFRELEGYK